MNETIKGGGPAFPAKNYIIPADLEARHVAALGATQGMTLRDYFAAKAIGEAAALEIEYPTGPNGKTSYAGAAQRAYLMADAMLAAREMQP